MRGVGRYTSESLGTHLCRACRPFRVPGRFWCKFRLITGMKLTTSASVYPPCGSPITATGELWSSILGSHKDNSIRVTVVTQHMRNTYNASLANTQTRSGHVLTRTRDGVNLSNWRQVIADGGNATTPLNGVWESLKMSPSYSVVQYTGSTPWIIEWRSFFHAAYVIGGITTSGISNDKADDQAKSKFLKSLRAAQTLMQGQVFLGELRETLKMLRRPAAGLRNLAGEYLDNLRRKKRGFPRNPVNWTKHLSDAWLEQAFGWTPLMHDINDAMKAYNSLIDKDRIIKVSKAATASSSKSDFTYYTLAGCPSYVHENMWRRQIERHVVRYRGAVIARRASTAQDRLARFGFTPQEFVPTAWELLPWSFLADYFANIGDVLEASVTSTSNLAWVNKTDLYFKECSVKAMVGTEGWGNVYDRHSGSPGSAVFQRKTVSRSSTSGSALMPSLHVKVPGFLGQYENMTALLGQANDIHPQRTKRIR